MQIDDILSAMNPEIYQRLVRAVELGKWPDGTKLTEKQKEHSLQAVMLWQAKHNNQPDHMTIGLDGQIVHKSKQELMQRFTTSQSIPVKS